MIEKRLIIGLLLGVISIMTVPAFAATSITIDNLVNNDSVTGSSTVDFTWDTDATDGTITFTQTGGNADVNSPHVYTLSASELLAGPQSVSVSFLNSDPGFSTGGSLVDGAEYTVTVESATDAISASVNTITYTAPAVVQEQRHTGGDKSWTTKPTFGVSYLTNKQIVTNGFGYDDSVKTITDNFHTPFDLVSMSTGEEHSFLAKGLFVNGLKIQEFCFGIPVAGQGYLAESCVDVYYDNGYQNDRKITDVKTTQKTPVLNVINWNHWMAPCGVSRQLCDVTKISVVFAEPLKSKVMMIKGIDQKGKQTQTYLNEGFDVNGVQFTELPSVMIPSTVKYEGLIKVTQDSKYSDTWTSDDGRKFERNSSGSFVQTNPVYKHDTDYNKIRLADQAAYAKKYFDSSKIVSKLAEPKTIKYPKEDHRTQFLLDHDLMAWARR